MPFESLGFAAFVTVVFAVYHGLLRDRQIRNGWLLAASWVFYATWSPAFLVLLVVLTGLDFAIARAIDRRREAGGDARGLLTLGVLVNLAPLLSFRYGRFLWDQAAVLAPLPPPPWFLRLAVPVGISFYTSHAISYLVDTYRRVRRATDSTLDFALYLAFFPKLVAGPITRWNAFAPQVERDTVADADAFGEAGFLLARGLLKKVFFADLIGAFVDPVWANLGTVGSAAAVLAFYAYPFQLYFDFSGYTDMARGLALLFGYRLPENFDHPYLAVSPTDFWRRWHITLSTWLRDYLFLPMLRALDRRRGVATGNAVVGYLVTMVLSGLWHGADWNYLAWGGLQGLWLALHRVWMERVGREPHTPHWVRWLGAFHTTCLTLVVFRAPTLAAAGGLLGAIAAHRPSGPPSVTTVLLLALSATLHVVGPKLDLRRRWLAAPQVVHGLAYGTAIVAITVLSARSEPFIYAQF
jgi:D-alanyl-lipoteichoic acid acyltransferase DltB (MBOAT superfamily)